MTDKPWYEFEESASDKKSDFYNMKVGDNKVRILTEFGRVDKLYSEPYNPVKKGEYLGVVDENYRPQGTESIATEGWAWAIDRETEEFKILTVGRGILKALAALKVDSEYAFDEFPMPYDVNIKNTGEGPARYSITPARKNTELTEAELADLETKTPIAEIISKMKDKKTKAVPEALEYPEMSEDKPPF